MPRPRGEPGPTGADAAAARNASRRRTEREASKTPSTASRREHAGKVPQPGVPAGPRNKGTVTPSGKTVAYKPKPPQADLPDRSYSPKPANKAFRELQVSSFKDEALTAVAERHFEHDDDGNIATTKQRIPIIKTSPKKVAKEVKRLNAEIANAKAKGVGDKEAAQTRLIGTKIIANKNYVTDKDGNVKYRTVEVPKIKTSPKAVQRDLARVNKITKQIRKGKRSYFPTIEAGTVNKTILGDLISGTVEGLHDATTLYFPTGRGGSRKVNLADEAGEAIADEVKLAAKGLRAFHKGLVAQQAQTDANYRAAGLDFIPEARTAAMQGVRTGVLVGTEYLTRPGLAIEAQIAKELGKPGGIGEFILTDDQRKKLADAASPLDVLLHGHGAKNAISGGDLTEALFGLPQAGLAVDILTDPLMYIGFAGLPAKFSERAAALTARIADKAPSALKNVEFVRLMENAQKSGDYESITKYLETVAKKEGVSTKRLGKTKLDKDAIAEVNQAMVERAREIADRIAEGRANAPKIKGKSIHVPGEASQQAAEEIAKFGLRRQLKPGFTLELRTPLGRKITGIEVPVPKGLASKKIIPRPAGVAAAMGRETESTKLLEMARSQSANSTVYRQLADEHERLLNKVNNLEATPTATRTELRQAQGELATFEDKMRASMMDARAKNLEGSKHMASMDEVMRSYNAKRFAHEIYRTTNALGRQTQRVFFHNVMQAIKPVINDRQARMRIGAHMAIEADTQARAILDEVAPLTVKEQKVMDDLRNIYKELETYGFETGTLKNSVENYLPRFWSGADDIAGPLHPGPRSEEVMPLGGKRGANSAFQQHRTMAEIAAIADKQKLAQIVRSIATKPITTERSLQIADQWFKGSKIRFAMEDMAQAVQRGQIIKESDMTDLQKAAYEWSGSMVSDNQAVPGLFQSLERTEGVLKLSPEAFKFHNFVEDPFTGLSALDEWRVKTSSAYESLKRIEDVMKPVKSGSPLHKHYSKILEQRKAEVTDLLKAKPDRTPDRTIPNVPSASEAPTAEQVGLATDVEIENFLPNATDEYIGTLKDFRRDHPDKFPVLDPLLSNYHRTRAEGLQTVYRTRWRALDSAVGRSTAEARTSRYVLADGRSGYTSDIRPVFGDGAHDKPIAYEFKESGERIDLADIEFPGRTLIPNREYKIWYDPITGREYSEAPNIDAAVGAAIKDTIGPDRLWPTDVIRDARAEFYRMGETGMTDLYDSGIENLAQRTLTMIRYGVTTLFPAFHFRNMVSDTFLSMLADPGMLFHPVSNSKLTWSVLNRGGKVKVKDGVEFGVGYVNVPGLGKMKPEDYLGIMDSFGLRSNQHIAEMARLAERGDVAGLEKWWQGVRSYRRPVQIVKGGFGLGPSGAVGRRAVEASARREDIMRIITFTQRMRRNKGDFADAMWWTIKHHFDYGDLTTFERRWMRNLFLFYTWYRKNIPLQFMSIITRPGFFSGMTNAYIDLAEGETPLNFNWSKLNPMLPDMSGPVPNSGLVPDYMFTQLAAPSMNWNGHALAVGFGAPWADMNLIGHFMEDQGEGTRQFLAMFNPAVSLPFQYAFQKDLLTGRTFDKRESSGAAKMLNYLANNLGFDPFQKDDDGNPVLPWQVNLAFNQLPIAGRLTGYFRGPSDVEDPGRLNKLFGGGFGTFLTGFNAYVSPKEGERLDAAYISRVIGRAAQRAALSEEGGTDADLREFDQQTVEWAKQLGIPYKYLEVVPGIGPAYVTQEEREGFKLGGQSPLTGGGSAGLGMLGKGGLGSINFGSPDKEYKSQSEESLEKLMNPGQFQDQSRLTPLAQSILPVGNTPGLPSNALASGADSAGTGQLNQALGRLKANRTARREGETMAKPSKERTKATGTKQQREKNDKTVKKAKVKERHETRKQFSKKLRILRNEVNKGKLPQFDGFVDKDQEEFAQWLTVYTGFDPQFVGNWVMKEGGGYGSEGVSRGEAGEQNWLGVGYPGYQTDMAKSHYFNDTTPKKAAKATAEWIEGKIGAEYDYQAAPSIQAMQQYKGRPAEEIAAYLAGPSQWGTGEVPLDSVAVTGYGGKKNPKAEQKLKKVEAAAKKAGFDPSELGQTSLTLQRTLKAKKLKGSWGGSWKVLKPAIKGFEVSSEKRSPDDPLSLSNPDSDHNEANKEAYAYDLPTSDGEPIAMEVAQRLGIKGYHTGDYTDWVSPKYPGYRFQILWAVEGHYDHVHVGARWTGNDLPKGTYLGGPSGNAPSSGSSYAGGGGGTPAYGIGPAKESPEQREKSVDNMRKRMAAAGGGGSNKSLGTGSLLTNEEAFNLGTGERRPGEDIVDAVKKALEYRSKSSTVKTPKFNVKSAKLQ